MKVDKLLSYWYRQFWPRVYWYRLHGDEALNLQGEAQVELTGAGQVKHETITNRREEWLNERKNLQLKTANEKTLDPKLWQNDTKQTHYQLKTDLHAGVKPRKAKLSHDSFPQEGSHRPEPATAEGLPVLSPTFWIDVMNADKESGCRWRRTHVKDKGGRCSQTFLTAWSSSRNRYRMKTFETHSDLCKVSVAFQTNHRSVVRTNHRHCQRARQVRPLASWITSIYYLWATLETRNNRSFAFSSK